MPASAASPLCSPTSSARRNLTLEEIDEARKNFQEIDLDSSGTIDLNELSVMFKKMNYHLEETEVMEVMSSIDTDDDGMINFTEFLRAVAMKKVMDKTEKTDERDIVSAFQECGGNEDKTGAIDVGKVGALLQDYGLDVDATSMFGNKVTYEQFSSIFVL